jgi:hypothetical protein
MRDVKLRITRNFGIHRLFGNEVPDKVDCMDLRLPIVPDGLDPIFSNRRFSTDLAATETAKSAVSSRGAPPDVACLKHPDIDMRIPRQV